jgi:hypothetical protein
MADLSSSIAKARKAGYNDAEIAAYIAKDPAIGSKVTTARKAGYSDTQIIAHLGKPNTAMDVVKSFGSGLLKAGAGFADTVLQATPYGQITNMLGNAAEVASTLQGKSRPTSMQAPVSVASTEVNKRAYKPQTTAGEVAQTIARNVPNAFVPAGLTQRAVNVLAPAFAEEGAGQLARASGASPTGEAFARAGGSLFGAGAASVRSGNLFRPQEGVAVVGRRSRQDVAAMRGRAAELRRNGVEPTLVDVMDDSGRGLVRAAANKQTPGRQVANDFAESRVLNLPDRMSAQARANMSRNPRTPDQIRTAEIARRSANADRAFGAVRADEITMAPETVQALRNPMGREAIAEAARRERDPEVRAALLRLANDALDDPSTPITVGMADRISRTLFGRAQAATRAGDNDLAATFNSLAQSIREPARNASTGYRGALEGFAADSRMTEAAGVGEQFMARNTDEFVEAAANLAPRERALAAAAGRRAVERAAGENPSSAIGVARRLAIAPEQQRRTAALLGPERANRLQAGMRAEVDAVENARAIAPGAGSSTFLNAADDNALNQAAGVGSSVIQGNFGQATRQIISGLYDAFRRRGLNDQQIENLVRSATDRRQTDDAIEAIARGLGPDGARLLELRNAAGIGVVGMATGGFRPTNEERP